jgi:transglutaminase-like putative cysteine protease
MTYRVTHRTTYRYSEPVTLCHNVLRLTPRSHTGQSCLVTELVVEPAPAVMSNYVDYFGNPSTFFTVQDRHQQLTVMVVSETEVKPPAPPAPDRTPPWDCVPGLLASSRAAADLDAYQFVFDSTYIQASRKLAALALPSFPMGRPLLAGVLDLTRRIHGEFRYDPQATTVTTPLNEVLENRRGVCQDFAHLEIGCLRSLGLAARYISGYLLTNPPAGQPRLVGVDASHAWLSVYCPGSGWIDLDPTNNQIPTDKHITLAWGRDYDDVSPIKGVLLGGGEQSIRVGVDVVPIESSH